jgi:hypothetical protein
MMLQTKAAAHWQCARAPRAPGVRAKGAFAVIHSDPARPAQRGGFCNTPLYEYKNERERKWS